ncbi:hypothetical protein [Hymenobacter volaticus]|uniref:Antitoxin VbhA domain-containing protein n=1 Tax=Hymenobacter volaticus TaxID=2932254 RepID=A0ABY4GFR5_9BACT|nr:hypothetical protein [Hymenobacter volaticus]UOQ69719.1 hypothetical protein MUN86_29860 [Hymenobacter volaticus]
MSYFPTPPQALPAEEQQSWRQRAEKARHLSGLAEAGILQVSLTTLDLLQRYVRAELTLEQLVRLQSQRLSNR